MFSFHFAAVGLLEDILLYIRWAIQPSTLQAVRRHAPTPRPAICPDTPRSKPRRARRNEKEELREETRTGERRRNEGWWKCLETGGRIPWNHTSLMLTTVSRHERNSGRWISFFFFFSFFFLLSSFLSSPIISSLCYCRAAEVWLFIASPPPAVQTRPWWMEPRRPPCSLSSFNSDMRPGAALPWNTHQPSLSPSIHLSIHFNACHETPLIPWYAW